MICSVCFINAIIILCSVYLINTIYMICSVCFINTICIICTVCFINTICMICSVCFINTICTICSVCFINTICNYTQYSACFINSISFKNPICIAICFVDLIDSISILLNIQYSVLDAHCSYLVQNHLKFRAQYSLLAHCSMLNAINIQGSMLNI